MISIKSPTRTAYTATIEQGSVVSGSVTFATRSVTLTPQGGLSVSLIEATRAEGVLQNQPKEGQ